MRGDGPMHPSNQQNSILDSYTLHETIGCGGFGKVKKATHKITGERVAIKILDKISLGIDLPRVTREIETLKTLNNPYICRLYHVFETTEKIFMVMEYCRGGELFDYIVQRDRLEESEARRIFRQIATAVAYIHARGIAHRDLKPENILLDDENNVKLIDFGLCAAPAAGLKSELETCCGSPAYAAPELIKGERYIGPLADVWSLGVLLYALLNGYLPFDDANLGNLYKKIQEGKYFEPRWLSEGSKNILRCMLQVDPNYRLSVQELLHHTWCQDARPQIAIPVLINDTCNEVLDDDVVRLMCSHFKKHIGAMKAKILEWNYESQEVATYFMLLARKRKYGVATFRSFGINIEQPMVLYSNNRIQKSLEAEFAECDTVDSTPFAPPGRPYFFSMEGGLDDDKLLQIGSPKAEEEKENNVNSMDYIQPKIPSPKKQSKFIDSIPNQLSASNGMSPARSADSVLTEPMKTPQREKWRGISGSPCQSATPSRRKVLGSIERGLDKVRLMLTPRTSKMKTKLKTIAYHGKSAFNISVTSHADPDSLITELKASLSRIGIDCKQRGYRLLGKVQSSDHKLLKFELEVVCIDSLNRIGIRRKRQQGDAWVYKRIIEQVLTLSGVNDAAQPQQPSKIVEANQTPAKSKPLQTMV